MEDINDIMTEAIYEIAQSINAQKELVIKQKIKEKLGIEVDLQEESQRRFKRFHTIHQGNEETIYFNDGSIDGKRIVTFVKKDTSLDSNLEGYNLRYEETYY